MPCFWKVMVWDKDEQIRQVRKLKLKTRIKVTIVTPASSMVGTNGSNHWKIQLIFFQSLESCRIAAVCQNIGMDVFF